jgi:stage III sporulation protein SpoIIIAA
LKPPIDRLELLLPILDGCIQDAVLEHADQIEELVLDAGCALKIKYGDSYACLDYTVTTQDLERIETKVGGFRSDWRGSLEGCLHRVAAIYEFGRLAKITIRLARLVEGIIEPLRNYIKGQGMLFIGTAGSGKTTVLRDVVRILQGPLGPDLVVLDGACELAGDGMVPHPCIGNARRFRIDSPDLQAKIMSYALESHRPKVLIFDELKQREAVEKLAEAARTGVKAIASVHGRDLREVVENPSRHAVLGLTTVNGLLQQTARPVFESAALIMGHGKYILYPDLASSIHQILTGQHPTGMEVNHESIGTSVLA